MIPLINNDELMRQTQDELASAQEIMQNSLLMSWFTDDFAVRFCWSSNAIEGNTLSLEETFALVEFDEVNASHTYTEYEEAKNLYSAIKNLLIPFHVEPITEDWIKKSNRIIRRTDG